MTSKSRLKEEGWSWCPLWRDGHLLPPEQNLGLLACTLGWKRLFYPLGNFEDFRLGGLLQIFHIWDFSHTKRMKYFPHHLFKRSKNGKTSVENFYFVYPFSEKKFRNTSQVDKSWSGGKIDLHPTAPDKSSFLCRMVWNKKCPFWWGIQFSQRLRTQE